ncbi:MAG TPA: ATP-binding cassette domain-containing protein [Bacteroidia bacterium]|jgi:ABC-type multidrug transport system ATPase subunit|nr:ATP-binding cassette domain-containing protein [Bacteroidia bacterium]
MVLSINNLSKQYGNLMALSNVSFSIEKGSVFGILGPNGSGKTTTLGIVLGVINSSGGSFSWFEETPTNNPRKKIGAILETPNFYHYLSAYKNLQIAADIKGVSYDNIERILEVVNLKDRKDHQFSTFSLGMKQRLSIASALLADPEVLVLDEPTNGLDPQGIAEIRELIISISKQGKTIILASHMLDEVEKVCTHVAVLQKGKILTSGKVSEILGNDDIIEIVADDLQQLEVLSKAHPSIKSVSKNTAGKLELIFVNPVSASQINDYFHNKGIILSHLVLRKKSLEAQFLQLTSQGK